MKDKLLHFIQTMHNKKYADDQIMDVNEIDLIFEQKTSIVYRVSYRTEKNMKKMREFDINIWDFLLK